VAIMEKLLNEAIERYCNHFSKQIVRVNEISGEAQILFRKILFSSILDALSRSVYPHEENRNAFTLLVKNFGDWPDHNRVSLPHLEKLLKDNTDVAFEKLRKIACERLKSWQHPMNTISLDCDPILEEIAEHWPEGRKLIIGNKKISLDWLTHLQLLYSHRNFLFHEFRTPGYGFEFEPDDEPYYHELSTFADEKSRGVDSIELVYPVKFLENLCTNVLGGLKTHLQENKINPYNSYTFGSYWIEQLNL